MKECRFFDLNEKLLCVLHDEASAAKKRRSYYYLLLSFLSSRSVLEDRAQILV